MIGKMKRRTHVHIKLAFGAKLTGFCPQKDKQCRGKLLLKVMHYNIALLPKKVTNYLVTFYGK